MYGFQPREEETQKETAKCDTIPGAVQMGDCWTDTEPAALNIFKELKKIMSEELK